MKRFSRLNTSGLLFAAVCLLSCISAQGQTTLLQADFAGWSAGLLQSGGAVTEIPSNTFLYDTAITSLSPITTDADGTDDAGNAGGFLLDQDASGVDQGVHDYAAPNDNLTNGEVGILITFTADNAIELTSLDFIASVFTNRGGFHGQTRDWAAINLSIFSGTGLGGTLQGTTWTVNPASRSGSSSSPNNIVDTLTGTPISLASGTYTVYLSIDFGGASSAGNFGGFQSFELKGNGDGQLIDPNASAVVITTNSIPSGLLGNPYAFELQATSPSGVNWSLTQGSLPAGLSLATSGTISGTPTESGNFALTFEASDVSDSSNIDTLSLQIRVFASATRDGDPRPNIVIINVDDMGWTDVAAFGSDFHETPNIDTLAADGLKFTSAYAACSVCSPTRAAMMTGKYPARLRLTNFLGGSPGVSPSSYTDDQYSPVSGKPLQQPVQMSALPLEETTYAEIAKAEGYATMHLGKWHIGGSGYLPQNQGFDINIGGGTNGQPPSYFDPYGISSIPSRTPGEYLTDREADEAETFIREHAGEPFLLNYWPYGVHAPLQGRADKVAYYQAKTPGTNHRNATYAAMVESIDDAVGQIRATLAELEINDNTLIIFTSDNGLFSGTNNNVAPATGFKGQSKEGGIRIPQIIYWPGVTMPGSVTDVPVSSIDLYPTIYNAIEASVIPLNDVDGVDMTPLLTGHPENFPNRAVYWHFPHYRDPFPYSAVRSGDWKLTRWYAETETTYRLTNLATDIAESINLSDSNPTKRLELEALMDAIGKSTTARVPIPISAPNYEQWLWPHMATTPADQRNPDDDPNHNGVNNAEEFISGGDPGTPGAMPLTRPSVQMEEGIPYFYHDIDGSVSPTSVEVQWSTNLDDWFVTDLTTETLLPMDGFNRFRSSKNLSIEDDRVFYRLRIEP